VSARARPLLLSLHEIAAGLLWFGTKCGPRWSTNFPKHWPWMPQIEIAPLSESSTKIAALWLEVTVVRLRNGVGSLVCQPRTAQKLVESVNASAGFKFER
jgi:hypothetical protein